MVMTTSDSVTFAQVLSGTDKVVLRSQVFQKVILDQPSCIDLINIYLKNERLLNTPRTYKGQHSEYINKILFRPSINSVFILSDNNDYTTVDAVFTYFIKHYLLTFYNKPNTQEYTYQTPIFTRYTTLDQFILHSDNFYFDTATSTVVDMYGRTHTVLLYLNDEFTGGSLNLPNIDLTITPKAGLLVMFPCDVGFEYEVTPVTGGNCYNLGTWVILK